MYRYTNIYIYICIGQPRRKLAVLVSEQKSDDIKVLSSAMFVACAKPAKNLCASTEVAPHKIFLTVPRWLEFDTHSSKMARVRHS